MGLLVALAAAAVMAEPEADASPESYYYGYYGGYPYHRGYWGGYRGYYGYPYRYWKREAEAAPTAAAAPAADADADAAPYYYGYYGHPYRYGGYYGGYYGLGYRGYYGYPYRYWKREAQEASPVAAQEHTIKKRSADADADASPESLLRILRPSLQMGRILRTRILRTPIRIRLRI